jgi:mannose-6-phosphate isomerase-like protein (cupin superfamily)
MNPAEFETALHSDGYTEVAARDQPPGHATQPHAHEFDIRALVLAGDITLTVDGAKTLYGVGEVFTMPYGRRHTETVGAGGVTTLAGRKYAA